MTDAEIEAVEQDALELAKALIAAALDNDDDALGELLGSVRTDLLHGLDLPEDLRTELERRSIRIQILVGAMVVTVALGLIEAARRAGQDVNVEALASVYSIAVALDADQ